MDETHRKRAVQIRAKAAACRAEAAHTTDRDAVVRLIEVARACEERAAELDPLHRPAQPD